MGIDDLTEANKDFSAIAIAAQNDVEPKIFVSTEEIPKTYREKLADEKILPSKTETSLEEIRQGQQEFHDQLQSLYENIPARSSFSGKNVAYKLLHIIDKLTPNFVERIAPRSKAGKLAKTYKNNKTETISEENRKQRREWMEENLQLKRQYVEISQQHISEMQHIISEKKARLELYIKEKDQLPKVINEIKHEIVRTDNKIASYRNKIDSEDTHRKNKIFDALGRSQPNKQKTIGALVERGMPQEEAEKLVSTDPQKLDDITDAHIIYDNATSAYKKQIAKLQTNLSTLVSAHEFLITYKDNVNESMVEKISESLENSQQYLQTIQQEAMMMAKEADNYKAIDLNELREADILQERKRFHELRIHEKDFREDIQLESTADHENIRLYLSEKN